MPSELIITKSKFPVTALPIEVPFMPEEFRRRAKAELFEDEDTRVHSLILLKTMLDEEQNLVYMNDDEFLIQFLRARKFDVKRAFNLVKNFYTIRRKHTELYDNVNFDVVRRTFSENSIGFLPYRDEEGCCILVIRIEKWHPLENTLADIMRALTFGLFYVSMYPPTQVAGIKVIVDCKGFTFGHVPHLSTTYLNLFAEALQNCFPARFKAVHIVNEGTFFSYVWAILKTFLTKKLKERFHFHGKNVAKLHKYFSPSILPAEYEGELEPFDNSDWAKKVMKISDYTEEILSYGYVKSKKNNNVCS